MKAAKSKPNEIERRWLLSPLPSSVACEAPNLRSTEMELDQRKRFNDPWETSWDHFTSLVERYTPDPLTWPDVASL